MEKLTGYIAAGGIGSRLSPHTGNPKTDATNG